jgi:hypothetical protein
VSTGATRVKHQREDDRVHEWHEHRPPESHDGLLVPDQEIALCHLDEQFAVLDLLADERAGLLHETASD